MQQGDTKRHQTRIVSSIWCLSLICSKKVTFHKAGPHSVNTKSRWVWILLLKSSYIYNTNPATTIGTKNHFLPIRNRSTVQTKKALDKEGSCSMANPQTIQRNNNKSPGHKYHKHDKVDYRTLQRSRQHQSMPNQQKPCRCRHRYEFAWWHPHMHRLQQCCRTQWW